MEYSVVKVPVSRVRVGGRTIGDLDSVEFVQSTVAKSGVDVVDTDYRLSEVSTDTAEITLSEDVSDHFNRILPPTKCVTFPITTISEHTYMMQFFRFGPVKVLKYLPGCFFKLHTDTRKGLNHHLTVLILPVKNYEGGELILHTNDGTVNITAGPSEWTLVMFRPDVPHEVTPVTSGVRYVFKTDFYSDTCLGNIDRIVSARPVDGNKLVKKLESYVDNFSSSQYRTERTTGWSDNSSDSDVDSYRETVRNAFEERIHRLLQRSLEKSLHGEVEKAFTVDDLLRQGTLRKGIYVMTRLYPGAEDETSLIGPHRQLYLDLKDRYRLVRLMTATFSRTVGEVTSFNAIVRIAHGLKRWGSIMMLNDEYLYSEDDFIVFYESDRPYGPHKFRTDYNDSSYNLETRIYTTVIMFMSPK